MFSCEYYEILKNIYFEEHLRTAASKKSFLDEIKSNFHNFLKTFCSSITLKKRTYRISSNKRRTFGYPHWNKRLPSDKCRTSKYGAY